MANLFKDMRPTAQPTKNGFDLSERHTYSARAGVLYPVMTKEVIPGDYFELDVAALSRTQTLVAPAFARIKQYHHFFFVPYNSLWHSWDEFYTQRLDPTQYGQSLPLYVPTFSLPYLIKQWRDGNAIHTQSNNPFRTHIGTDGYDLMRCITDLLGYGDLATISNSVGSDDMAADQTSMRCNAFRVLAYNKIWNDYYRNHYRDELNYSGLYNVDDCKGDTLANSYLSLSNHNPIQMFLPKYRGWSKDIFMGSMPNSQFGDISIVSSENTRITNLASSASTSNSVKVFSSSKNLGLNDSGGTYVQDSVNWKISELFDVLALRKAEKLQAWKQSTLIAGNRSKSQYMAHLGVAPYRENDHASFIGGFESFVTIDEVTQTTGHDISAGSNELGTLAGKGLGTTQGNKIKFKANDFGVIMCIVSFVPELEYDGGQLDKANTLFEQFDFFTPEFENLGLSPVTKKELSLVTDISGSAATPSVIQANENRILGYAPAYYQYKTAVDRCHLQLSSFGNMSYYSAPRRDIQMGRTLNIQDFYINPTCLDSIFGYSINWELDSDQFICVSAFDVKAIRPMSVLGLPSF